MAGARSSNNHSVSFKVRFAELDPYGHVNHAMYFSYLEFGRTEALMACDLKLDDLVSHGIQLVVTKAEVRFRQAAGPHDILTVETAISQLRRASAVWSQQITRQVADGSGGTKTEAVVSAQITAAVTGADGRPTRPPEWLFEKMAPLISSESEQ